MLSMNKNHSMVIHNGLENLSIYLLVMALSRGLKRNKYDGMYDDNGKTHTSSNSRGIFSPFQCGFISLD